MAEEQAQPTAIKKQQEEAAASTVASEQSGAEPAPLTCTPSPADGAEDPLRRRLSEQLITASGRGLTDLVQPLLNKHADVRHARTADGWTALIAASASGSCSAAQLLLGASADIGACGTDGFTALMEACAGGHKDMIAMLLRSRAFPGQVSPDGTSPLILASMKGDVESVRLLMEHRADVTQAKRNGFTALRAASANGHVEVTRLFLQQSVAPSCGVCAQVDASGDDGVAALLSACAGGHVGTARLLLEHGVKSTATAADGTSALLQACMANHREVAALLIQHGADLNSALEATRRKKLAGARRVLLGLPAAAAVAPGEADTAREGRPISSSGAGGTGGVSSAKSRRRVSSRLTDVTDPSPTQSSSACATLMSSACAAMPVANTADERAGSQAPGTIADAQNSAGHTTSADANEGVQPSVASKPCGPATFAVVSEFDAEPVANAVEEGAKTPSHEGISRILGPPADAAQSAGEATSAAANDSVNSSVVSKPCLPVPSAVVAEPVAATADKGAASPRDEGVLQETPGPAADMALSAGHATNAAADESVQPSIATMPCLRTTSTSDLAAAAEASGTKDDQQLGIVMNPMPETPAQVSGSSCVDNTRLSTQLLTACGKGLLPLADMLLGRSADPNYARQVDGWTPLMAACSTGRLDVVELLVSRRADVGVAALDGFTALLEACVSGYSETVEALLSSRADVEQAASSGATSIIVASLHGHEQVVTRLLRYGANIGHRASRGGQTALQAACGNGHRAVAQVLLNHGHIDDLVNTDGVAAMLSACANGHVEVVRLLLDHGVPATAASADDGTTALMKACMANHREVASLLMAEGADVEVVRDAARKQNSLSGVERVLRRARPRAEAVAAAAASQATGANVAGAADGSQQEACDLDALVREIEGPSSATTKVTRGRKMAATSVHRKSVAVEGRTLGREEEAIHAAECSIALSTGANHAEAPIAADRARFPSPSSSSSASARWLEQFVGRGRARQSGTRTITAPRASATAATPSAAQVDTKQARPRELIEVIAEVARAETPTAEEAALPAEPAPIHHDCTERKESNVAASPPRVAGETPGAENSDRGSLAAAFPSLGDGWTLRRLPVYGILGSSLPASEGAIRYRRGPGTFYTVEVLAVEPSGCSGRLVDSHGALSSGYGGISEQHRDMPWNAAVVAARCRGWPVSELALIPYDAAELAEMSRLAEGGIKRCWPTGALARESPRNSTASEVVSSISTLSLPDRDATEEFAAWCVEAQRRCQTVAQ